MNEVRAILSRVIEVSRRKGAQSDSGQDPPRNEIDRSFVNRCSAPSRTWRKKVGSSDVCVCERESDSRFRATGDWERETTACSKSDARIGGKVTLLKFGHILKRNA